MFLSLWRPSCLSRQPGSLLRLLYALPPALQFRNVSPRTGSAALRAGAISSLLGGLLDRFTLLLEKQNIYKEQANQANTIGQGGNAAALLLPHITAYTCRCHGEGFILVNFHCPDIRHFSEVALVSPAIRRDTGVPPHLPCSGHLSRANQPSSSFSNF